MSKITVRKIFIAILIFLPLQYILVGVIGYYHSEPWPAFVFPGFKNVYETEGEYSVRETRFELYNDQNEMVESVKPLHFFSDIPRSQIGGFLRSRFYNSKTIQNFSVEGKDFLQQKSTQLAKEDITSMKVVFRIEYIQSDENEIEIDSTAKQLIGMIHFSDR